MYHHFTDEETEVINWSDPGSPSLPTPLHRHLALSAAFVVWLKFSLLSRPFGDEIRAGFLPPAELGDAGLFVVV